MIRAARPTDQAFVASSWSLSMTRSNRRNKDSAAYRMLVDSTLDHPSVRVAIACDPDDTDRIIGWLVYTQIASMLILHYAFVREKERRKGIARAMVDFANVPTATQVVYTFEGPSTNKLKATALRNLIRIQPATFLERR